MKDFTKSNKWMNAKRKYKEPFETVVFDYLEVLERQLVLLEQQLQKNKEQNKQPEEDDLK